jgi:hypothetical protein
MESRTSVLTVVGVVVPCVHVFGVRVMISPMAWVLA